MFPRDDFEDKKCDNAYDTEECLYFQIRGIKQKLSLPFSDNDFLRRQGLFFLEMRKIDERDENIPGGIFQLDEGHFERTQHRNERFMKNLYEEIKEAGYPDWNHLSYGNLATSNHVSFIAALLNVQLNFHLDQVGPGVTVEDHCEYFLHNVNDTMINAYNTMDTCLKGFMRVIYILESAPPLKVKTTA